MKPHARIEKKRIGDAMKEGGKEAPPGPRVDPEEKVADVVQLMLSKNLKEIGVERDGETIGKVKLEDLLKEMGLDA